MKLEKVVFMFVAMLGLAACSDDTEEEVLYRMDEQGLVFSPTEMEGSIEYMPSMIPKYVKIVNVDGSLNPVDSFEVPIDTSGRDDGAFSVDSRDYEFPYVKVVTVFPLGKKSKMEFPQYVHLKENNKNLKMQFYGTLISGRIETLMRNKDYSFDDAEKKAYEELGKSLRMNLGDFANWRFTDHGGYYSNPGLYDMTPFVLCKHEISDSAFYSEYKEFRKEFAEKGLVSSAMKARGADAWLSTFKMPTESSTWYSFESMTRDTAFGLGELDTAFFNWAYELAGSWKNGDSLRIINEHSVYYRRMFVYDYGGWRLRSVLEDTLGTCQYGNTKYIENEGRSYLCRYDSFTWEKLTNTDSILRYKYFGCDGRSFSSYGSIGYLNEKMFVCNCDKSDNCKWNEVKKDFKATVLDTPTVNVLATLRYGECKDNEGERKKMDSLLVLCHWKKWIKVDSVTYELGACYNTDRDKYGQMPSGEYYKCKSSENEWKLTTAIEANGIVCNRDNWDSYKKFEGRYYYCDQSVWREVPEDSVYKPILVGDSCNADSVWNMKKYGDEYFICRSRGVTGGVLYNWAKADTTEIALYDANEKNKDYCKNGRTGTSVLQGENSKKMYGCMESDYTKSVELTDVTFYEVKTVGQTIFSGGTFVNDSTYEVVVDSTTYGFKMGRIIEDNRWKRRVSLIIDYVKYGDETYDAVLNAGKLIIFSVPGKDSVDLLDIKPASESFEKFYPTWYLWVEEGNRCSGSYENAHFPIKPFKSMLYRENTYKTFEQAKAGCPKGFYIPDTTEWKQVNMSLLNSNVVSSIRDTFDPDTVNCVTNRQKHLLLLWSESQKDSSTHYCYGKILDAAIGNPHSNMLECPNDLYPLAQAIYVKRW